MPERPEEIILLEGGQPGGRISRRAIGAPPPRITTPAPDYKLLTFPLDKARTNEKFSFVGNSIVVKKVAPPDLEFTIRLSGPNNDPINMKMGEAITLPYTDFYLTTPAIAGGMLHLFISTAPGISVFQSKDVELEIARTVTRTTNPLDIAIDKRESFIISFLDLSVSPIAMVELQLILSDLAAPKTSFFVAITKISFHQFSPSNNHSHKFLLFGIIPLNPSTMFNDMMCFSRHYLAAPPFGEVKLRAFSQPSGTPGLALDKVFYRSEISPEGVAEIKIDPPLFLQDRIFWGPTKIYATVGVSPATPIENVRYNITIDGYLQRLSPPLQLFDPSL